MRKHVVILFIVQAKGTYFNVWTDLTNAFRTTDTQHTGRGHLNIFLSYIRVGDPYVDITWQGYPTCTFSDYRKENLKLSNIRLLARTYLDTLIPTHYICVYLVSIVQKIKLELRWNIVFIDIWIFRWYMAYTNILILLLSVITFNFEP